MAVETTKPINKSLFTVVKIEAEAVIVLVDGWRMRAYFEKDANRQAIVVGGIIELEHYGNASNPHELQFLKIK